MKVEVNETFPVAIEAMGTVMDYSDGQIVFVIKDEVWLDEEIKALRRNKAMLYYVYEKNVSMFLLNIDDELDTSDFIFHVDEMSGDFLEPIDQLTYSIYFIDEHDVVKGAKHGNLSNEMKEIIQETLRQQRELKINENLYEKMVMKLQYEYEPFELEEKAKVMCSL